MSYSFGHTNKDIRIRNWLLTQSGTYQTQELRPFQTTVDENVLSRLESATHGGRNLGISAIQSIAAEVIRPSAQPEGSINIAQGWTSRRFRFMMHVEERHRFNAAETIHRIIFGYTDHCDASYNHLDPQMRVYFNSETLITEAIRQTIQGPVKHAVVAGSNQIVTPIDTQGQMGNLYSQPHAHLIRPEDVFNQAHSMNTLEMLNSTNQYKGGIDTIINTGSMVSQGGSYQYSQRRDTSPTRYFADTLGSWQHAVKEAQMESYDNKPNMDFIYGEATANSSNQSISENGFLAILKDTKGYMDRGYVTYQDLCSVFPEAGTSECTKWSSDTGQSIRQVNHSDQSMHWRGSEPITIAASLLGQVIPAIMMDNFVRMIGFACTNGNGPNNYRTELHGQNIAMMVDGLSEVQYLEEFKRRLVVDALNVISMGNQIPFMISVFSDLAEDTVIDISLGNEPTRRYVVPTFTDSLFSPVITRHDQALKKISGDMMYMVQSVVPVTGGSNGQPSYKVEQTYGEYKPTTDIIKPMDNSFSLI